MDACAVEWALVWASNARSDERDGEAAVVTGAAARDAAGISRPEAGAPTVERRRPAGWCRQRLAAAYFTRICTESRRPVASIAVIVCFPGTSPHSAPLIR